METNECRDNNGGCWQDKAANITACKVLALTCGISTTVSVSKFLIFPDFCLIDPLNLYEQDTFRGRVCECPVVDGVQFKGDGYSSCTGKLKLLI